jgi:predicted nucleotide-binding protein (sugar kinase/HSP70/actin superfamily)
MTGDMLRLLKEDGADPAKTAFFMPGSCGSCRYDLFNTLQQVVFEDNGLQEAALVDEYRGANKELHAIMSGMSCGMLSWRGFIAADILEKLRLRIRPYEMQSGATDALYFQCLARLAEVVENKGNVERAVAEMVGAMSRIPVDRSEPRPVIGLVGEAYLRNVDYAARNIIRKVEDMGGEVRMPAIMEVLWYTLYKQWYFQNLKHKRIGALLRRLQHRLLFRMEKSLRRHSEGVLDHPYEKPLWEVNGNGPERGQRHHPRHSFQLRARHGYSRSGGTLPLSLSRCSLHDRDLQRQ